MSLPPTVFQGDRYGRLEVIQSAPSTGRRRRYLCRCDCGKEIVAIGKQLRNGHTTSCGCRLREIREQEFGGRNADRARTHGHTVGRQRSRTYRSWEAMRRRCLSPACSDFPRYGGAGVSVCERWAQFATFLADMGERPDGTSLDRIDPHGDYEPANCRWATPTVQRHNRRAGGKR